MQNLIGIGLGLRLEHLDEIIQTKPKTPWFEVIMEDYLVLGPHHKKLEKIKENHEIVMHSVGLNLGGVDEYDLNYLEKVKQVYDKFNPQWISDHLCWSSHKGMFHHDLLPIPKTKEGLDNICSRINFLQDFFKREFVLENITSYLDYENEQYTELEFIQEILKRCGSFLLLDITNVIINHKNRNKDYKEFFETFPLDRVKQIHLAGGEYIDDILIDSHSANVGIEDLNMLMDIYNKGYQIPAMIERDSKIPSFQALENERLDIEGLIREVQ